MKKAHPIPDAAFDQHIAVLGTSGYGKTNAIKGAVERLLARGERVVIVDPTGVWWGLRLMADGKRPSPYPLVIFGGRHADLPLDEHSGDRVAEILGGSTTPAVLDTQMMKVAARTRFFTAFAEAILRENKGPLHLVIDEAHLFAPQAGGSGRVPDLLHATNNLVSLGRTAGLRLVLISQRPAKVHKDSLSQCPVLVVMGLIDPRDRKAAKDWLDGAPDQSKAKEIMASLAGLPIGTGWIYAPRIGVLEKAAFPLVSTFDSGRPEANADAPSLKPLDVAALRAALRTDEAAPEAATKVASKAHRAKDTTADVAAEQRGYERGFAEGREAGLTEGLRRGGEFAASGAAEIASALECVVGLVGAHGKLAKSGRWALPGGAKSSGSPRPTTPLEPEAGAALASNLPRATPAPRESGAGDLNSAAKKMLAVLDSNPPVRRTWSRIATIAGLKARGGHFNAGRRALIDGGLVSEEAGGLVTIRKASASAQPEKLDLPAIVANWEALLSGAAPRIFRHLFDHGETSRASVAEALGMKPLGGHWNAAWKELRDNDLIVQRGDDVRLSDLFTGATP